MTEDDEEDVGGLVKTVVDGVKQRKQVDHFQQSCWRQLGSKDLLQLSMLLLVINCFFHIHALCWRTFTEADHYSYC